MFIRDWGEIEEEGEREGKGERKREVEGDKERARVVAREKILVSPNSPA